MFGFESMLAKNDISLPDATQAFFRKYKMNIIWFAGQT
jgi:hypothetical protein